MKRKILVIGSSHAKRLFYALKKQIDYSKFSLMSCVVPGANYRDIRSKIPKLSNLNSTDIIIIQTFGNRLFDKQFVRKKDGIFHLTKFKPSPISVLLEEMNTLKRDLEQTSARVIIIDNPIRHLCCKEHLDTRIKTHQTKVNKQLYSLFSEYKVLDHARLAGLSRRVRKSELDYSRQFVDAVHLFPKFYVEWARNILSSLNR
jgi:hypothetical protein